MLTVQQFRSIYLLQVCAANGHNRLVSFERRQKPPAVGVHSECEIFAMLIPSQQTAHIGRELFRKVATMQQRSKVVSDDAAAVSADERCDFFCARFGK